MYVQEQVIDGVLHTLEPGGGWRALTPRELTERLLAVQRPAHAWPPRPVFRTVDGMAR